MRSGWGGVSTLTTADAQAIKKECPAVADVTYFRRQVVQVIYGEQNWSTAAQGSTPSFENVRQWSTSSGSFFTQRDEDTANRVVVLGQTVVDHLFGPGEDPVGAAVRIKDVPFRVVGVLEAKGQTTWGQDQDDVVLMPFSTAERRVLGTQFLGSVDMIFVSAASQRGDRRGIASRSPPCCTSAIASNPARKTTSPCAASTTWPRRRRAPAR